MKYLRNVGLALDKLINAVAGGAHDETVSERAAREELTGKRWACYLCKWFHYTVERNHCAKTLDPHTPTKIIACVRALAQMLFVVWLALQFA